MKSSGTIDRRSRRSKVAADGPRRRSAFTLLELLVALGLVTILLAALGAAIDFHYRVVQKARDQVEEAQLARALLDRIAKDIRGAVPYDPVNFEKLIPGLVTQGGQGGLSALGEAAGLDSELFGELTGETEGTTLGGDWTTTTLPRTVPGLYGGSDWIEVDVSRLPRPDQLSSEILLASEGMLVDRVSDVKTVAYFVVSPEETINYTFSQAPGVTGFEEQGGLVRRELDRAVTAWAAQAGELDAIDQQLEPIAPEVAAIQFAYFDGTQWIDSWDSDAQGCLPKAVEVRLYLRTRTGPDAQASVLQASLPEEQTGAPSLPEDLSSGLETGVYHVYRTVVYLPAAHETGTLGATGGEEASGGESSEEMAPESETESQPEEEMTESPEGPGSGPGSTGGQGGGPNRPGEERRDGRGGGDQGRGDGRGSGGETGRSDTPGGPGRGPMGPPTSGGFGSTPPSRGPGGPPPSGFGGPSPGGSPRGNIGPPPAESGGGRR